MDDFDYWSEKVQEDRETDQKTITVTILREDAEEFVNGPLFCASDGRIADAFLKGLKA